MGRRVGTLGECPVCKEEKKKEGISEKEKARSVEKEPSGDSAIIDEGGSTALAGRPKDIREYERYQRHGRTRHDPQIQGVHLIQPRGG